MKKYLFLFLISSLFKINSSEKEPNWGDYKLPSLAIEKNMPSRLIGQDCKSKPYPNCPKGQECLESASTPGLHVCTPSNFIID